MSGWDGDLRVESAAGPPYQPTPLGYQKISSLSVSTSLTVPAGATYALISVELGAIRYRDDGPAPTASNGMPLLANQAFICQGTVALAAIKFIQQSGTAGLSVLYYK